MAWRRREKGSPPEWHLSSNEPAALVEAAVGRLLAALAVLRRTDPELAERFEDRAVEVMVTEAHRLDAANRRRETRVASTSPDASTEL